MFAAITLCIRKHSRLRRWLAGSLSALALILPACDSSGNFTVGGYTTMPNYDDHIRTVYVPIFENRTFRKNLEFDLTRAVVREIEAKTPFKVVSDCEHADTELIGRIVGANKLILNRNQLNEVREAETTLAVEVVWRDRRTGEILSNPGQGNAIVPPVLEMPALPGMPSTAPLVQPPSAPQMLDQPAAGAGTAVPGAPPAGPAEGLPPVEGAVVAGPSCPPPLPVLVTSQATFIPELGGSLTTSYKATVDRLAIQIVSMMESPW